ncbi:hypothetical protein QM565_18820 [Geitlerinema splendidum]|nr:hypothetical protein [Geitlerinema splendidum]
MNLPTRKKQGESNLTGLTLSMEHLRTTTGEISAVSEKETAWMHY